MISPTPPRPVSPALGWLLLMPAVAGMLISLLLPTVQTVLLSFRSGGILTPGTDVGMENYARLFGAGSAFWTALGFSLSLVLVPLVVALVVGPLLALALDRAGSRVRQAGRVVLSLSLIVFSPTAVAASWSRGFRPGGSDGPGGLTALLVDPGTAPAAMRLIIAAATFGVVCALAVLAFLPALRGESPGRSVAGMAAVAAVVVLAMAAAGVQTFSAVLAMTRGGPRRSTHTPAVLQYDLAFVVAQPGRGAAVATLTGVLLGVLGLAAALVVVTSGMRLSLVPRAGGAGPAAAPPVPPHRPGQAAPSPGNVPVAAPAAHPGAEGRRPTAAAVVIGVAALVAVAGVTLVLTWPWAAALLEPSTPTGGGARVQINTWVPALTGAVVSVGTAYLAALGIGGLRPLGRRSEWLLLAFAPWLFVGVGPLSVADWTILRGLGLVNTFPALIPPFLVSVPALFVLTLLCKGLAERNGRDLLGGVVRPSLPMAAILTGAVALVNAQDLLWPLLVAHERDLATAPVALFGQLGQFGPLQADAGLTTPLPIVAIALIAVVAAQLLHLDRLALTVGRRRDSQNQGPTA